MTDLPAVVEFFGMAVIKWKGWYICCDEGCPENNGMPHVWATLTKPTHNTACGKCKRITWNRKDNRFKDSSRKAKKKRR
jgi:hypothetical protein